MNLETNKQTKTALELSNSQKADYIDHTDIYVLLISEFLVISNILTQYTVFESAQLLNNCQLF